MTAYILFQRDNILDQEAYDRYASRAMDTLAGYDAEPVVVHGQHEVLEGDPIEGIVVLKFPDIATAKAWFRSDTYQEVVQDRHKGATYRVLLVEGLA